jgi:hypothetical protein
MLEDQGADIAAAATPSPSPGASAGLLSGEIFDFCLTAPSESASVRMMTSDEVVAGDTLIT